MHSDSHDVFVFQTAGAKQWEIHTADGVERDHPRARPRRSTSRPAPRTPPARRRPCRCTSRSASTSSPGVGWSPGRRNGPSTEVPDDHLPAGYLDDPDDLAEALAGRLEELAASIRGLDARAAVHGEVRRFLTGRSPRLPGGLRDALAPTDAPRRDPAAPASRAPLRAARRRDRGGRLEVLLGDRVPARARTAAPAFELRPGARHVAPRRPGRLARPGQPARALPPAGARGPALDPE